jgi:5-methylcytosine-specific restriction enzyme subunit McrC
LTNVKLREWETARPEPGSVLADQSLAAYPTARQLAEELTKTGRMEVLELKRGLELRATSFVGRFGLGELTVTIHPKIPDAPLLSLFRYAYGLRQLDLYGIADFATSQWSFQDLLIQQLAAEASELLERGIHRDYEFTRSDLSSPRGRIDFTRYARPAQRTKSALPCVHYPRSENTLLNRVLLAGLTLAADISIDHELRTHVRRIGKMLSEAVAIQPITRPMLAEAWRTMDRRTSAYEPALTLIDLLLGDQGVTLDGPSRVNLRGFLFDMNRFFQTLIMRFVHEHLSGVVVRGEYRLKGMFRYVSWQNPLARRDPTLRPDFVVMRDGKMLTVLDAKYRDLWESSLPREMLYQLALYALGHGGGERASTILYPTVEEAAREQSISIHEPVHGAPQASVALRPVNLLKLEGLLRAGPAARPQRVELATQLVFPDLSRPRLWTR